MKRGMSVALAAAVVGLMGLTAVAQPVPDQITTGKASRTSVKTVRVEVPIDKAARRDTPEFRGEGWFQQKCGVCHLGRWRKTGQLEPFVSLVGILGDATADQEAGVSDFIQTGSVNMPGFRNALTPTQLDELIEYLKTL